MTPTHPQGPADDGPPLPIWRRRSGIYVFLGLLTVATSVGSLYVGTGDLDNASLADTFLTLRALRTAAAFLAGAALAVGGVLVQGLFRNPLASPSVVGTTAGAMLGGQLVLLMFQALLNQSGILQTVPMDMLVPLGCTVGAFIALSLLFILHRTGDDLVVLLLFGFLLSHLFLAFSGFITSLAQARWELARAIVSFTLGDVSGVSLRQVQFVAPLVGVGMAAAYAWGNTLDIMLSGEEEAQTLGVDVAVVRRYVVLWTAVLTAAAVSLGGNIGFVGLVVPHSLRPFLGVAHRGLVLGCALLGGCLVVACDTLTRAIPSSTEIPLGSVTSLVGGPLFIYLLFRSRKELHDGG